MSTDQLKGGMDWLTTQMADPVFAKQFAICKEADEIVQRYQLTYELDGKTLLTDLGKAVLAELHL